MAADILISFIIPVWNREKTIGFCIDSILSQYLDMNFEIIIVDDYSSDNSVHLVEELIGNKFSNSLNTSYLAKILPVSSLLFEDLDLASELKIRSRINIVKLPKHQGAAIARNKGIEKANGMYIWFVDSDDFIANGALKTIKSNLLTYHFDILRFGKQNFTRFPDKYRITCLNKGLRIMNMNNIQDLLYMLETGAVWCAVFRRDFIANNRFDARFSYSEDSLFSWQITLKAKTAAYLDVLLYGYMYTSGSLTSVKPYERFDCYISVVENYVKAIKTSYRLNKEKSILMNVCERRLYLHAFHTFTFSEINSIMWNRWYEVYYNVMINNNMRAVWKRLISYILWKLHSNKLFNIIYNRFIKVQ